MTSKHTIDAIIANTVSINALIWRIRNGKKPSPRTISLYREHVEALSALLISLEQQTGEPIKWIEPVPFSQIVGRSPEEKRRLGYRGWFRSFERAPVQFLEAAE